MPVNDAGVASLNGLVNLYGVVVVSRVKMVMPVKPHVCRWQMENGGLLPAT